MAGDDVLIAGALGGGINPIGGDDFAVIQLPVVGGSCEGFGCLAALNLGVIKIGHKFEKKWLWGITATGNPLAPPPANGADDPVTAGATIELSNPTTGERGAFVLPAGANWTHVGGRGDRAVKGYIYQDKEARNGPCSRFSMVSGKRLKLKCKTGGGAAPFSLDERSQGSLDVRLVIGRFTYCLSTAGGEVVKDQGGLSVDGAASSRSSTRRHRRPAIERSR